ncbi:MAG: LptA/OstA family protein [Elusimicrobiaceae bacterium]|nr:LptA/OstA family protein [Elusimicrobiaceae bacterium]
MNKLPRFKTMLCLSVVMAGQCFLCAAGEPAGRKKTPPGIEKPSFPPVLGGVVKSDYWKMYRTKGVEVFKGSVSYTNPDYRLKADYAEVDRASGLVRASGGVNGERFWPNGNTSLAKAARTLYSMRDEKAQLWPAAGEKVSLTHNDVKKGTLKTFSDTVIFNGKTQTFLLTGDAEIEGNGITTLSKNALYDYSSDTFELYGNPVIWGSYKTYDFAITGSSASASNFYENIKFEGDISGWLRTSTEVYREYGTTVREH